MAQFQGDIVLRTLARFDPSFNKVINKIEQVSDLVNKLNKEPLNIFGKSGGPGGDIASEQLKSFQDAIRNVANSGDDAAKRVKLLGNTAATTAEKAQVFAQALDNVRLKTGGLKGQEAAVKNLARAWGIATEQAGTYSQRLDRIQNDALREAQGLQPQAQRDFEVARRLRIQKDLTREKQKQANLTNAALNAAAKQAQQTEKNLAAIRRQTKEQERQAKARRESLLLGVGFPLLFGGGAGSVLGSAAGAIGDTDGGFGGQIFGGAIGQAIDNFVQGVADLGKALNPLTGDVEKVAEAAGLTGTELGTLISEIDKAGDSATALKLATNELESVVGTEGVQALKDFGEAAQDFSNLLQQEAAKIGAAVARAFTPPADIQEQLSRGDLLNQARQFKNPDIQAAVQDRDRLTGLFSGSATDRIAAEEKIIALVREENAAREETARLAAAAAEYDASKVRDAEASNAEKRIELEIEQLNASANDETRIALEQKLAFQRRLTEEQSLYNQFAKDQITIDVLRAKLAGIRLDYEKELAAIQNRATNFNTKATSAPQSQAASLQKQIIQEELKRLDIRAQALELVKGEEAALKFQESQIATRLQKETEIIELQRQQALERNKIPGEAGLINTLHDERLKTATQNLQVDLAQNRERQRAIALERELADLKAAQEREGISTDLTRQIEDAQFRIDNPFGGFNAEQAELAIDQARRYQDVMRDIADQEAIQRKAIQSGALGNDLIDANAELDRLAEKKKLYQELLPVLDQVEQQELKMQQTLQTLQPITDGLAAGIADFFTSVIDGSKSAEEAFADMLKGMGQALVQQAAVMIAQYIAIGIARAFAGMGGGTGGEGFGQTPLTSGLDFSSAFAGRANGGPVAANRPYIVGEREPELFVPNTAGTIYNQDQIRSMSTNYGPGNETTATAMAPMNSTINYNGPMLNFNGDEYIPRSEAQSLVQAGAKQGEARTLNALRNQRSTRSRIGI